MALFTINKRTYNCPLELTLSVVGGKWKMLILLYLRRGEQRYSAIYRHFTDISHKILAEQLREMEGDELLTRTVHAEVPPRVVYALTPAAEALVPTLLSLANWGLRHVIEGTMTAEEAASDEDVSSGDTDRYVSAE